MRLVTAALITVALGAHARAADPPTKAQQRCLLALDAAGTRVATAAVADSVRCARDAIRGAAGRTLADCLANPSATTRRAQSATTRAATKKCATPPTFGPASADDVNAAFGAPLRLTSLFGDAPDATLGAGDHAASACQLALAQELGALARARVGAYAACVRQRVAKGQATVGADLDTCVDAASRATTQALKRATARVGARCRDVAPATACPGDCATSAVGDLGACVDTIAACGACLAANASAHLGHGCHVFADGVAVHYCGTRPATTQSVARQWDEEILAAIRRDNPRPPVHARNLFHFSAAMWDAWAAYDQVAVPYVGSERATAADVAAARAVAISFAAYRVVSARYSADLALGADASRASFDARMNALGLDKDFTDTTGSGPASVGNRVAAALLAARHEDGANEANNYGDPTYSALNLPLIVKVPDIALTDASVPGYQLDPNHWQPLALDQMIGQNGVPLPGKIQKFVGSQWGGVTPFALTRALPTDLYLDPGPQPTLGGTTDAATRTQILEVIQKDAWLDPDDTDPSAMIDVSPAAYGNNPVGSNAGVGYTENPVTHAPYPSQIVARGDFGRVLAEYWADGPTSETPPGHWNLIANQVSDTPGFAHRLAGAGPELDRLEWDVKLYFAMNGAVHDAAIACWGAKRKYDGVRPITLIRYLAKTKQLPETPGLIETITTESSAPGQRHAALAAHVGEMAIRAWPGAPAEPKTQHSGTIWVLGTGWIPYQRATFVTPAFPGYYSGHSTFSRSAAEVLAAFTGSPYFPNGLGEFTAPANAFLQFEQGPSHEVRLQWASYFDAADQAGQSRLWGGIHVEADDFTGRTNGRQIGLDAFAKAQTYFAGGMM